MPRKVKSRDLDSRTARLNLKVRGMPYYKSLDKKLHLGYRRLKGKSGTWWYRIYLGDQQYAVEPIGTADDQGEADGVEYLNYWQAQDKARELVAERTAARPEKRGPYTVNNALDDYFKWLESEGRSAAAVQDAKGRAATFIRPKLGEKEVAALIAKELRTFRNGIAESLPRVRTKPGENPKHRSAPTGATADELEDAKRARRGSANRIWTILRAALNHAYEEEEVSSNAAWDKVKPFKGVDKARTRYLNVDEARRLANATDPVFRPMVEAALLTGGRYSQLARLVVTDFNRDAGTVKMSTRKGDGSVKVYDVHLTNEGVSFFNRAVAGLKGKDRIFTKNGGGPWLKSDQARPMQDASDRAKIEPAVNFHCLRHTYASHAVMNGAPLLVVAENLGHRDTRMVEMHYANLAPSYKADVIRDKAPRFGFKTDRRVATLR
jgi:integrase